MELTGKAALVTGGTRGIGRGIAERFLEHGASVMISGRNEETGKQALHDLGESGRVTFVAGDVSDRADAERMVDATVEHYGRLDVVVNNAGGMPDFGLVANMSDEVWHQNVDLNLHSVFYVTRRALAHMIPQQSGRIITISSILGKQGDPGLAAYAAAKHGLIGLTQALAQEVGALGITANCICPGIVLTDMIREQGPIAAEVLGVTYDQIVDTYVNKTAIGRSTTVDEVAAMAVLLASEAGAGITGSALSVDGGVTLT